MEGLPRSCYMRPLTYLDSEPSGLMNSLRKHPVPVRGMSLGETSPPLVHGALSFYSEVCGAEAQGRDEGLS